MYNAISFKDQPHKISWTTHKKGKVPGEEQNQKMSVFYSVSSSKPAGEQAPIALKVVAIAGACFAFEIYCRKECDPKHKL